MHHQYKGFTLPECLAVTAVIGILAGVAVPALNGFIEKQQADTAAWALARQLNGARTFAINAGRKVTFCGVDTEGKCNLSDTREFVTFIDEARDRRVDEGDSVFDRVEINYPGTIELKVSAHQKHITFNADGTAHPFGHILLCPHRPVPQLNRLLAVQRMGRAYLETDKNSAGIVEKTGACNNH